MGIIDSDHSLQGRPMPGNARTVPADTSKARSSYTYLFPDLADAADAGLFPGTTAEETLLRLKQFEEVFRRHEQPTHRMALPAAYTYFGQFMNHDLSAPVGSLLTEAASIPPAGVIGSRDLPGLGKQARAQDTATILDAIRNEQAMPLTLESLYAEGPGSCDEEVLSLYAANGARFRIARTICLDDAALGMTTKFPGKAHHRINAPDIPRNPLGHVALIADRRNDENLLISQLHLAFMLLHNKLVAALAPQGGDAPQGFDAARRLLTRHYHWIILNDYLPKLLSPGVLAKVMAGPPRLARANAVPMEFTTAAFRFGHSMVSQHYDFNSNFGINGRLSGSATLHELFAFTSRGGMQPFGDLAPQLPDHWVADWDRLTRTVADPSGADRIDVSFAADMLNHMSHEANLNHASIFFRNLVRGFHRRIPFGQTLAKACGLTPMTASQVVSAMPPATRSAAESLGLASHTPAWLYFLCEAKVLEDGERLGPAASHVVAETIVGLLRQNPDSLLNRGGGNWHPRQSVLKQASGAPLDSLRALLLHATDTAGEA